jgi:hypothetical protein
MSVRESKSECTNLKLLLLTMTVGGVNDRELDARV